jgi:hypothetical protein
VATGFSLRLYPGAISALINSPSGPVARDLARRAIRVSSRAQVLCAVDTGRLRSSVTWRIAFDGGGIYAEVGTNVFYGVYVELGTRYMSARPFLVPALAAAA